MTRSWFAHRVSLVELVGEHAQHDEDVVPAGRENVFPQAPLLGGAEPTPVFVGEARERCPVVGLDSAQAYPFTSICPHLPWQTSRASV
jgi:hypothetical protein